MLQFENLALRRGARLLFEEANFQIHPGQKVGITGANGSGKSSFFALILGELHADAGTLRRPDDWVIAQVAQETPSDRRAAVEYVLDGDAGLRRVERELSQAEAADEGERLAVLLGQFEAIGGYTARSRAGRLLSGLGFEPGDENRVVSEFSGGWRMRLNLARALMCRSDLLLLDEPTNHLDLDAVIWLENWLRDYPGTLLLISHDRDFLDRVSRQILHVEDQRLSLYNGNYSAFERRRAEQLARRAAEYAKQQREVAHIRAYVDRFRAKATRARQAQSRLKALQRMEQIAPAHVDSPFHFSLRAPEKTPNPLLRLEEAAAGYGEHAVLSGVSLVLSPGDRIGLLGPNGAGKSTLIKLLAGRLDLRQGRRETAQELRIGYFAQHQLEQLHPEQSALEHLQRLDPAMREQELRDWLGGFGFAGDQALRPTAPFSGGEKSRLALALLVYQRPNLLLLDEPTNHLDLEMRQALALALQEFSGAMLLVSHDRHLLRVTADRLLLVHAGGVDEFPESLDEYPAWLEAHNRQSRTTSGQSRTSGSAAARRDQRRQEAERRSRLQPLRNRIREMERALAGLHARQSAIEHNLAEPGLYQAENKEQLKTLLREKAALDGQCTALEAEWLVTCERLEFLQGAS
ncbi:MAG: ATP-binding cassette domain-containing protein [Gammaproteobacteria bacterium]|jgi:ATP-binding cassette subfamily F protein 3